MSGVYVLAGTGATVQVFPSQQHPTSPTTPSPGGGPIHRRPPQLLKPRRRRDDDETALAVLAAI